MLLYYNNKSSLIGSRTKSNNDSESSSVFIITVKKLGMHGIPKRERIEGPFVGTLNG